MKPPRTSIGIAVCCGICVAQSKSLLLLPPDRACSHASKLANYPAKMADWEKETTHRHRSSSFSFEEDDDAVCASECTLSSSFSERQRRPPTGSSSSSSREPSAKVAAAAAGNETAVFLHTAAMHATELRPATAAVHSGKTSSPDLDDGTRRRRRRSRRMHFFHQSLEMRRRQQRRRRSPLGPSSRRGLPFKTRQQRRT